MLSSRQSRGEVDRSVIIECPGCRSKYQYDEERFERKPSKKIRCARCQQVFEIHNPAFAQREAASVDAGEMTYASRTSPLRDLLEQEQPEEPPARQTGRNEAAPALPLGKRLSLAILDGPDAGSVFRIERPRVSIGRSNADLTLNDSEASRQHAAIEVHDNSYTLVDLGSTNGTLFEGSKIEGPVALNDKSEFQVGTTTLMLIITDEQ